MAQVIAFLFLYLGLQERPSEPLLQELTEIGIECAFPPLKKAPTPIEKGLQFLSDADVFEKWIETSPILPNKKGGLCEPPFKKKNYY